MSFDAGAQMQSILSVCWSLWDSQGRWKYPGSAIRHETARKPRL